MEVRCTSFWCNSFETIKVLTRFPTTSHTTVNDNLDDDFNANDSIIKACEPRALHDLAASLSKLELLEEHKYDHLIQATEASDSDSDF